MPIRLRRLTMALTDRRRDASRLAYVPAFLVLALLTPHAIEDGGWYFPVLLLVCGGQMWRPTFAGWGLVTAAFAIWAVTLIAPGGGSFHERGEYSLFLGLALIPTAALLLFRPKRTGVPRKSGHRDKSHARLGRGGPWASERYGSGGPSRRSSRRTPSISWLKRESR